MPDEPSITASPPRPRFWTRWTIVWVVCWIALFTATHTKIPGGAGLPFRLADKVIHFGIYFTLVLLGARAAMSRNVEITGRWALRWAGIYMVYAAADELLQTLVGRNCSLTDWIADVLGVAAAMGIVYVNSGGLARLSLSGARRQDSNYQRGRVTRRERGNHEKEHNR